MSCEADKLTDDPIVQALRWASAMVNAGPQYSDLELSRAVAEICTATATWVCDVPTAMTYPAGRAALQRGGAVVQRSASLPGSSEDPSSTVWLLAVPDSSPDPALVVFVARPLSVRFTDSEIARVKALASLHRGLADPAPLAAGPG